MYIGCFGDANERALSAATDSGSHMTVEACDLFCRDYLYFGVQFSSQVRLKEFRFSLSQHVMFNGMDSFPPLYMPFKGTPKEFRSCCILPAVFCEKMKFNKVFIHCTRISIKIDVLWRSKPFAGVTFHPPCAHLNDVLFACFSVSNFCNLCYKRSQNSKLGILHKKHVSSTEHPLRILAS